VRRDVAQVIHGKYRPPANFPLDAEYLFKVRFWSNTVNTVRGLEFPSQVEITLDGTRIKLTAGPTNADNLIWWQVEGRTGWVAADYLRYPDAAQ